MQFLKICKNSMIYCSRLSPLSPLPLAPLLRDDAGITVVPEGRRRQFDLAAYIFVVCCHSCIKVLAATVHIVSQEHHQCRNHQCRMCWLMSWKEHVRSLTTHLLMAVVLAKMDSDEFKKTWSIMKSYHSDMKEMSLRLSKMLYQSKINNIWN